MRTIPAQAADPSAVLAFIQVVRCGTFRAAARALGVSKSSVSQRIADLEEQLGARLLSRTTRSVTLTDIGASYHREVEPVFDALQTASARVQQLQARPSGRLRITAPVELGQDIFGEVLARYETLYPEVALEVSLTDRVVNLVEEGFDLALRVGPLASSGLIVRTLSAPQTRGVYASPGYLRRYGTPKEPRDLLEHRCLAMSGSQTPSAWTFSINGKPRSVAIRAHVTINSFQVLRALAIADVGITNLPMRHASEQVATGQLKMLLTRFAPPARTTLAVYPSQRNVSPALRAMVDLLVEFYENNPLGKQRL
jgi:DNA-binding transcriptional LysR family regulator